MKTGKRLKILTRAEIDELYAIPSFSKRDRQRYFYLVSSEKQELKFLRSTPSKVHFILLLGYFKAKRQFFYLEGRDLQADINHILREYFPRIKSLSGVAVATSTRLSQQLRILNLLDYKECSAEIRGLLSEKALRHAAFSCKPVYVLKELMRYLENNRIVMPPYSVLQNIVGRALTEEKGRLESIVLSESPKSLKEAFDRLLENNEDGLYDLTVLQKEPKDFSYKVIKAEVKKRKDMEVLYQFSKTFIPRLGISNDNIRYYASLTGYYSVYRLKRIGRATACVYLMCFIFERCRKINDDLVNTFIHYVNKYIAQAKREAKEEVYRDKRMSNDHLDDAAKVLNLFIDDGVSSKSEFGEIRERAFGILPKEKFPALSRYISGAGFDEVEYEWDSYVQLSMGFKKNLRYIFMSLDFQSLIRNPPLLEAVFFFKTRFKDGLSLRTADAELFPKAVVPSTWKRYLYDEDKNVIPDKYEFLVYRLLRRQLESGDIFVKDSLSFRSFEEDLIDGESWKDKDRLIRDLQLPYFHESIEDILAFLEKSLESKLESVNRRIRQGRNSYFKTFKRKGNTRWKLAYQKIEDETNHAFYSQLNQESIGNVMKFANDQCAFMESFSHILRKDSRSTADRQKIMAAVLAWGLNIGLVRMAEISDMSYGELVAAGNNFIRPETLKAANDFVVNKMMKLDIFKRWNLKEDTVHSSSDGQKFEARFSTFNSRHSSKYFGLKKGVVSYTLIANHAPANARMIGAHEHESHYVYDVISNNTSDLDIHIHSTDTHGTNEVNFAILHIFGYGFAPRYRDLAGRPNMIYGFRHPSRYEGYVLKPVRKINADLIRDEWDNIQRIIVSLALKTTTQAAIVRKLSSHERKNRTKRALWEYDNIIKSLYVLDYIDSIELRQNVYKALNRGEAYHQLRKAIAFAHSGKFRVKTEREQHIWNECSRLVANCIIFYNAWLLSELLSQRKKPNSGKEEDLIKKISPVAWRHVNFYGRYNFYNERGGIKAEEIMNQLRFTKLSGF